jgi:hypothetical protein
MLRHEEEADERGALIKAKLRFATRGDIQRIILLDSRGYNCALPGWNGSGE